MTHHAVAQDQTDERKDGKRAEQQNKEDIAAAENEETNDWHSAA